MDIDDEYKRNLSEQFERILQEKDALEQTKEKACEIGKFLLSTIIQFKLLSPVVLLAKAKGLLKAYMYKFYCY